MDCTSFNWVAKQPILTWFFSFLIRVIFSRAYLLSAKLGYLSFTLTWFGTHLRWILNYRIYLLRAMLQESYYIDYLHRSSSSTSNYKHELSLIKSQYCEISCTVCVHAPSWHTCIYCCYCFISFWFFDGIILYHSLLFISKCILDLTVSVLPDIDWMEINIFYHLSSVCKQPNGSKCVNVQLMFGVENEPYETLSTP